MSRPRDPLLELNRQIAAAAKRVEEEIAIERKRRRRWKPDLIAWRTRRARYLAGDSAVVQPYSWQKRRGGAV